MPQTRHILYPGLVPRNAPLAKAGRGARLCREVAREGRWLVGSDPDSDASYLALTPQLINQIVDSATERMAAGMPVPLQYDHSTDGIHTDAKKVIHVLEEFWVESHKHGLSAWAACYPGDRYNDLVNSPLPVSPHISWGVADGTGKVWPVALMHVAIVDHATIPAQNGFVEMALTTSEDNQKKGVPVDFATVVEMLNQLLGKIKKGLALPETVDEASLPAVFEMVLAMAGGEETPVDSGDDAGGADAGADAPTDVAMRLKSLEAANAALSAKFGVLSGIQEANRSGAFAAEVDAMISAGTPAACRKSLLDLGKATNWDLSGLDGFKSMAGISMSLKSTGDAVKPTTARDEYIKTLTSTGMPLEAATRQADRLL